MEKLLCNKTEQIFGDVQRAVHFNHEDRGVDRLHSVAKEKTLRKNYKTHLMSSFLKQKTVSMQTSRSAFANRIEQVRMAKFEVELVKKVD